jgi:ABC-type bacteriocin/lantibiotic exporter with double-glycine peptidase domain
MGNNILYGLILIFSFSVFIIFGRKLYLTLKYNKNDIVQISLDLYFLIIIALFTVMFLKIIKNNKNIEIELKILFILFISFIIEIICYAILRTIKNYNIKKQNKKL